MGTPPKQIGQSAEANLLWNISKQLDNLRKTSSIVDPILLAKIDELITVSSEIEISAENINLNTDDLETLIEEGNALLEEIRDNTASGSSFDGQLTQDGNPVSDSNPLPIKGGVADTTFQDSTGQLFVFRDNGIDTPTAYKIPDWTAYTPVGAVTATSSPLTNYALETGGKLASIDTKLGTAPMQQTGGSVSVTNFPATQPVSASSLPLPTGASTAALQTTGNTTLSNIDTRESDIDYNGSVTSSTPFVIDVEEKGTLSFTTSGTWVGTIIVEASLDGIDWRPTTYVALSSGNSAASFTANTSGQINCVGLDFIRFRSNTISSGSATIIAMSSRLVSNVMLDNPLPTGSNTIGKVQIDALTNGTQKTKITDGTLDASLLQGGGGYVGVVTSVGPALFLSSTANSSTTQLAANATFTGTIETVFSQPAIQVNMVSDQPMIITINQYIDAAGLKRSGSYAYSISAGAGFDMCLPMAGNYFNITAQNIGTLTTTTFTLDVTYGTMQAVDTYGAQTVSITQLGYGSANSVYVGGTSQVQVTPTLTSASAYASGNVVGGLLTFPNIVNSTVKSGVLESISIAIKSLQTASFKLYIFKGLPSTTFTNKTAPAIVVGDADKLLDVYSFTTPDNGLGNNVTLYYSDAINRSLVLESSSMYGVLVCIGTPTFTTTTDVVVTASILRD
jgi:hypothetical protein